MINLFLIINTLIFMINVGNCDTVDIDGEQKCVVLNYVDRVTFDTLIDDLKPELYIYYSARLKEISVDKREQVLEVFKDKYSLIAKKKDSTVVCAEYVLKALNFALLDIP